MRRFLFSLLTLALCITSFGKDKGKHMALTDGLIAHWGFEHDPIIYGVWDNVPPHRNNLVASNFPSQPSPLVNGKLGKAIETDGGGMFSLPSSSAGVSHQGNPFTVAFWFKPTALNEGAVVAVNNEWNVTTPQSAGSFYFQIEIDGKQVPVTSVPLVVGEWYHVCFGWYDHNGSFVWAVVNLSDRVRGPHVLSGPTLGPFLIGGGSAPGVHDDFAIWRRALSAQEIRALYNHGKGLPFEEWDKATACPPAINCCD